MPTSPPYIHLSRPACGAGPCDCPKGLASVLSDKYAQLCAWRLSHEALGRDDTPMHGAGARKARQRALAQLSSVYPGALRELERVRASVLQARQRQAAQAPACVPVWLRLVWDYHALWHRSLAYRRFCRLPIAQARPGEASGDALAGRFASWYERAAGQTPWAGQAWPASWRVPQQGAPGQTLKQTVETLLEQRYALSPACIAQALWGEGMFDGPSKGSQRRDTPCRSTNPRPLPKLTF